MKWRKKQKHLKDIFRVSVDSRGNVLDLKPRSYTPRRRHFSRRLVRHARYLLPAVAGVGIALVIVFVSVTGRAQTASFYPTICLGSWKNPEYAQDEPESRGSIRISADNAAVVSSGGEELFCGNFLGDIPEGSDITRVSIRLALQVGDQGDSEGEPGGGGAGYPDTESFNESTDSETASTTELDTEESSTAETETETGLVSSEEEIAIEHTARYPIRKSLILN